MNYQGRFPSNGAIAVTVDASVSSATDVTLNDDTTWVRVCALSKGIYVRNEATASAANWDWFVPPDDYIDIDTKGLTVLSFIEQTSAATLILAEYN